MKMKHAAPLNLLSDISDLTNSALLSPTYLFSPFYPSLLSPLCLPACMPNLTSKDPEAQYSTPSTGGRQAKDEMHYENTDLYENMPSPKLATRYAPKSSSSSTSSSSASNSHYKTPVNKVSSKFLSADAKTKDAAQVTSCFLTLTVFHLHSVFLRDLRFQVFVKLELLISLKHPEIGVYMLSFLLCSHCCGDFTNLNLRELNEGFDVRNIRKQIKT